MIIIKTVCYSDYYKNSTSDSSKRMYLNNNEAGSNEDDKGLSEEIRKMTQQTSVLTAGSKR